ncbi:phage tail tube protein [Zhihengliuella flava]|uniref:Uncharacterized protein n=1 Tax=Zhihengliuella flava TaxID=1285193 RepID=A0A931DC11_9MICC|nr:hypothetical protein [Zhihengliuella flava]MBG6085813.1 hypothetical protein [Zhihengliuella flava]
MKVAADGKKKFTILTTAPADPKNPTVTELEAGIDASCQVLDSDANWTNAASDTFNEKAACQKGNSQALGASNYDLALTFLREFDTAGGPDAELDAGYQAVKVKGTTTWVYLRESDKDSTEAWEATDEIYLGGEVVSDAPARVDQTGNIKRRVTFLPQTMIEGVAVASGV